MIIYLFSDLLILKMIYKNLNARAYPLSNARRQNGDISTSTKFFFFSRKPTCFRSFPSFPWRCHLMFFHYFERSWKEKKSLSLSILTLFSFAPPFFAEFNGQSAFKKRFILKKFNGKKVHLCRSKQKEEKEYSLSQNLKNENFDPFEFQKQKKQKVMTLKESLKANLRERWEKVDVWLNYQFSSFKILLFLI